MIRHSTKNADKVKQARRLVLNERLTQKEAAKIVGVTEKTIGGWAKEYKWHEEIQTGLKHTPAMAFVSDFEAFLKAKGEMEYQTFKEYFDEYRQANKQAEKLFFGF